jgi:hypothetical protein
MYQYLIIDEAGSIVYAGEDKHHTKQLADVLSMRTGKPHFVDCMLTSVIGLCDHVSLPKTIDVPDRKDEPCNHL